MDTVPEISSWHIYVAFGAVVALGFLRLLRRLWYVSGQHIFANEFRDKFIVYCDSRGNDEKSFTWMMLNSNRLQREMGAYGLYGSYKPPFSNYAYKNYPIILNMLPELRSLIERDVGRSFHAEVIVSMIRALDEALLRYIGVIEERAQRERGQLLNPFFWLSEGVTLVLSAPLILLSCFGLLGTLTLNRIQRSFTFRLVSVSGGLVSVIASFMTIFLGWGESIRLMLKFLGG